MPTWTWVCDHSLVFLQSYTTGSTEVRHARHASTPATQAESRVANG